MDEIDFIGSSRGESRSGDGYSEVQRTMSNQLGGFELTKNNKVVMATNHINFLDSVLLHHGRIDRKIEFPPPVHEARASILRTRSRKMSLQHGVNLRALAEKMGQCSGAEAREEFELVVAKVLEKIREGSTSVNKLFSYTVLMLVPALIEGSVGLSLACPRQ
ncbi:26S Proteasome Regulatory ATPase [Pleurotus pulmonarius]